MMKYLLTGLVLTQVVGNIVSSSVANNNTKLSTFNDVLSHTILAKQIFNVDQDAMNGVNPPNPLLGNLLALSMILFTGLANAGLTLLGLSAPFLIPAVATILIIELINLFKSKKFGKVGYEEEEVGYGVPHSIYGSASNTYPSSVYPSNTYTSNSPTYATFRSLQDSIGVDRHRILEYINLMEDTYINFDYKNVECQQRLICDMQKHHFGSMGKTVKNLLGYLTFLTESPFPVEIRDLFTRYKEAARTGRSKKKDCNQYYKGCKFSIAPHLKRPSAGIKYGVPRKGKTKEDNEKDSGSKDEDESKVS